MKGSVRAYSLTLGGAGEKTLASQDAHGKRLDGTSQKRRVRDAEPLVYGSLDLRQAYDRHVAGARMNKGLKRPVLHALVQFPTEIPVTEKNEKAMLRMAVDFINKTHGGDAVFAARLDRDESGRHTVDVFYAPKYTKSTKSRGDEVWVSTTKHGKELCEKHRAEIVRRNKKGLFTTGPRQVGMALQSEFHEYMLSRGIKLDAKIEKDSRKPDRQEPASEVINLRKVSASLSGENKILKGKVAELGRQNKQFRLAFGKLSQELKPFMDELSRPVVAVLRALAPKDAPPNPKEPEGPSFRM